jgi:nitrate reductase gamma subunit
MKCDLNERKMEVNSQGFHLPGPFSKVVAKYKLVKYLHFILLHVLLVIFGFSGIFCICIHAVNFRTLQMGESC